MGWGGKAVVREYCARDTKKGGSHDSQKEGVELGMVIVEGRTWDASLGMVKDKIMFIS